MILSIIGMLGLACIFKADFKTSIIVFGTHTIAQALSIKVRGLVFLLTDINYATIFLMMFDGFFWLLLFYFYFNYKEI